MTVQWKNLGKLAYITSGIVDIVDPLDIGNVQISKPTLATNVNCTVYLNKGLVFSNGQNKVIQEIGNVTQDSDLALSYHAKEFFTSVRELYFQAQITFTRPDGTKYLRIITKTMPISHSREEVEKGLKSSIIGIRAVRESAELAQKGDYQKARINLISNQRLLQRGMKNKAHQYQYINFIKQSERLDGFMREAQQQEEVFGLKKQPSELLNNDRRLKRDDSAAKNIVQMKNVNRSMFETV